MRRLSDVLKEEYGEKVYKLALSSGCTCPNRDGTLGTGGCTFCSASGSGDFAAGLPDDTPDQQIEQAKRLIRRKTDARKFIAYYQSFSNTYGDPARLKSLYTAVISRNDVVILSLGTRPDCLGPGIMEMLSSLNRIKPVWCELGLQTIRDDIARSFHRGYDLPVFEEGYRRLKKAGLTVIVHVIFGLPGETKEDMLNTVRYLAELDPPPDGVKLQMLHIIKGTEMGRQYLRDPFPLLTLDEYADLIAESFRILPGETVLHRMTGDAPGPLLIAPEWTRNKKRVLNTLNKRIRLDERRST